MPPAKLTTTSVSTTCSALTYSVHRSGAQRRKAFLSKGEAQVALAGQRSRAGDIHEGTNPSSWLGEGCLAVECRANSFPCAFPLRRLAQGAGEYSGKLRYLAAAFGLPPGHHLPTAATAKTSRLEKNLLLIRKDQRRTPRVLSKHPKPPEGETMAAASKVFLAWYELAMQRAIHRAQHAISIIRVSTAQARAGRRCPCRPRAFSQHFPATKDAVIRPYLLSSQAVAAALRRSAGVILLELAFVCEKVAQEQVPQRRNTGPQIWLSAGRSPCGGTKKPRIFPRGLLEASLRHHMSPNQNPGDSASDADEGRPKGLPPCHRCVC